MYLLRHGQSYFNLHFTETRRDPGIEDPELTALGREQAQQAARALEEREITRIIVSPYTRALQTVEPFLGRGVPVEVWPGVRERTAFVCDVGSRPDELAARFPRYRFDHLPPRWWHDEVESEAETVARAEAFRAAMREVDHETTLLVSHWGFILALTGISVMNGRFIEYDLASPPPENLVWRP
nr:histidine phosphatase family protein [Acidocella sp.]